MLNNIQNMPFSTLNKSKFNASRGGMRSTHFGTDHNGTSSVFNNASLLAHRPMQEMPVFIPQKTGNDSSHFQHMQESLYLSPKKSALGSMHKNQSMMGGHFRMVSLQGFDYGEKFFSAQKNKGQSHEEKKDKGDKKEYKELIDTFKNYQGECYFY
jgi:hypothetical protein